MKKCLWKSVVLMLLCACMAITTSCSKKDAKALLSTVPAETTGLMFIDLSTVWDQLDIKVDGDDVSYCKEIKELIGLSGIKKSYVESALQTLDGTAKSAVVFEYDEKPYITFYVKSGKDFIKLLEDEASLDFDEEDDFQVADHIAVKGEQVWVAEEIDTEVLEKFLDLDKKERFTNKYEKIAESMLADDVVQAYFINIDNIKGLINNTNDAQAFGMVLGMCFDDAAYVVGLTKLTDAAMTSELRVLNSKEQPAEFLLPMAEINASALRKLNNDAPFIFAGAINPALTEKIVALIEKFNGISSSDRMVIDYLKAISGTFGMSFANAEDCVGLVNFSNATAPAEIGALFTQESGLPFEVTTAGNALVFRLPGTPTEGKGQAPKQLVGQYAGLYIDLTKDGGKLLKGGYDLSKLGKMWITLGPDGKGIKLTSTWEVKNPVRTLLSEGLKLFHAIINAEIQSSVFDDFADKYMSRNNYAYNDSDSVAIDIYDDYYYYEDEAVPAAEAPAVGDDYYY